MLLSLVSRIVGPVSVALVAFLALAFANSAHAQFQPPSTVYGSIADPAGLVPEGTEVRALIDGTLCSYAGNDPAFTPRVVHTGDGDARVAAYTINVWHEGQREGCGFEGAEVTIQIGDRTAEQVASWSAGLVENHITFDGAQPAVIPTFTPTPTSEATATPPPPTEQPFNREGTPIAPGQLREGTPAFNRQGTPLPTLQGGVTSSEPSPVEDGDDDGGFPLWAMVLVGLGVIAVAGGGLGYALARNNSEDGLQPPTDG